MAQLDGEVWRRVSPFLDEALELDPSAREPWLDELDKAQPEIARELRELLNLQEVVRSAGFLERSLLSPDDVLIGTNVGAYTIVRLLGRGGMGSVWLGRRSDEKFEGKVAIKLLERRGLGPLAVTQIRHEANLLARLSTLTSRAFLMPGCAKAGSLTSSSNTSRGSQSIGTVSRGRCPWRGAWCCSSMFSTPLPTRSVS